MLPTALILAVLAGSAVAFAVSEGLKLEKRPITPTDITKVFSPVCRCPQARANVDFKLLKPDTVTLTIIDAKGATVRRLIYHRRLNKGRPHHFTWNGRDDAGRRLPNGSYKPKIELSDIDRTFVLPNPIRIDVTVPRVRVLTVHPRAFSPDGDGRSDRITIRYRVSEHANALLLVNGRQRVRTRFKPLRGELQWNGSADGRKLRPGTYRLALVAVDQAGNRSRPAPAGAVRLRYLELGAASLRARSGEAIRVPVDTDVRSVRWTVHRGLRLVERGTGSKTLAVRVPKAPGRYVLVVEAAGHQQRAVVVVRR
jgi:FlgD Ig-like domain